MFHKLFVRIKKNYRSSIDKALKEFRKNSPRSESQKAEAAKHKNIHDLRDNKRATEPKTKIWEDF
jgi:hypothetical protein